MTDHGTPPAVSAGADDDARADGLHAGILAEFMRPPADVTVSQWADLHRRLSGKASSEAGPWRTSRTPYLRQIMDDLSARSSVQEVCVMFAAQMGKSEAGNNWIGYIIDNEPGPMMCVQPTTDMAKRFSRQRIAPMLLETPALSQKISENRSRDDANTINVKEFAGGVLVISGANSAASLRSMPVRYLFLDEIDAYPLDVDGEGDPVTLAEKRTATYSRRKVLKVSTPTTKGISRIESAYDASNACRYHVPCPHCGEFQELEWGAGKPHGIKWGRLPDESPDYHAVHYVCKHCGGEIEEQSKTTMLAGGQWVATKESTRPGRITGYHLNALYAPLGWLGWADLVAQWHLATLAAKQGDVSKTKTFVNTVLAETWEEQGDRIATHELARRAEDYPLGIVPIGGLMLTMGVDVQGNRLECRTWAWGRGQESWLVQRELIYGDPALEESQPGSPWAVLTERRKTPVIHASGVELSVAACAIDTGGHHTQQVYAYVRAHQVLAVKGASIKGKSLLSKPTDIDVTWRGQRIPRGVKLWLVGTDIAKGLIYGRLRIDQPGPGYVHLPKELTGTDEFEQLTAERLVTRYNKGFSRMEWIKPPGRRNEALDCYVYALAAAVWAGIERFTEKQWRQLEAHAMPEQEKPEAKQAPAKQPIPQPEPQNPVEIRRQIIRTVNRSRSAPTW